MAGGLAVKTLMAGEVTLAFQKASMRCEVHSSNSKRRELAAQTLARVTHAYELLSNCTRRATMACNSSTSALGGVNRTPA